MIEVTQLTRIFRTYKKQPGFWGGVRGLFHREYEETAAAKDVSFRIAEGEFVGFLGPNGAGKTTLMNILSGLYRPDSGKILIDGKERTFRDPAQAIEAGIGMVHQHFMLVPVFDVVESVALGSEPTRGLLATFDRAAARERIVE